MDPRIASDIKELNNKFKDIILEIYDYDDTGEKTTTTFIRKTFTFRDHESKLHVTERFINKDLIDKYQYNWVTKEGKAILYFHSEPHKDEAYQPDNTEPHHIHPPDGKDDSRKRLDNFHHQELSSVLELIRLHTTVENHFRIQVETKNKKR
jgi:hypothetical protein